MLCAIIIIIGATVLAVGSFLAGVYIGALCHALYSVLDRDG